MTTIDDFNKQYKIIAQAKATQDVIFDPYGEKPLTFTNTNVIEQEEYVVVDRETNKIIHSVYTSSQKYLITYLVERYNIIRE